MWKIVFNTSWYETWSPIHINSTRYECVRLCLCSIGTENVNLHNINKFTFICFRMFRGWRAKKSLCIWLGLGKTRKYLPLVHSFYFACSPAASTLQTHTRHTSTYPLFANPPTSYVFVYTNACYSGAGVALT